jgi:ABC-type polysaccharide/polyol phosphate export permease
MASVCTALTDFIVATLLIGGMLWFYGVGITWYVVLFPIVLAVHLVFITGIALLLAVANLLWRDVRHVFDVAITIWMFASAVVYPVQRVGGRIGDLLTLNPMTHIIEAYRDVLVRGQLPHFLPFGLVTVGSLLLLVTAWFVFHRSEQRFAEFA